MSASSSRSPRHSRSLSVLADPKNCANSSPSRCAFGDPSLAKTTSRGKGEYVVCIRPESQGQVRSQKFSRDKPTLIHRRFSPGRNGVRPAHRHSGKTKYPEKGTQIQVLPATLPKGREKPTRSGRGHAAGWPTVLGDSTRCTGVATHRRTAAVRPTRLP